MLARQFAIGFGIAIIFPLLIYYGVATFYPPPKINWYQAGLTGPNATTEQRQEAFEKQEEARQVYDQEARKFARVLFWVAAPLGTIALLAGAWIKFHAIGAGLMFGGISTVAEGCWHYWDYLPNGFRFGSLLIAFAVLVVVAYMKLMPRGSTPA